VSKGKATIPREPHDVDRTATRYDTKPEQSKAQKESIRRYGPDHSTKVSEPKSVFDCEVGVKAEVKGVKSIVRFSGELEMGDSNDLAKVGSVGFEIGFIAVQAKPGRYAKHGLTGSITEIAVQKSAGVTWHGETFTMAAAGAGWDFEAGKPFVRADVLSASLKCKMDVARAMDHLREWSKRGYPELDRLVP
jgi:hypothetical protein